MNKKKKEKKKTLSKADLHLHTNYSDGMCSIEQILDKATAKNLSVLAITDHNLISSAIFAKKLVEKKRLGIEIIIGEEISTRDGEIIGLFLKEKISHSLSIEKTIAEIKAQDGLVITPHPNRVLSGFSLSFSKIDQLVKKNLIDGIEIYNFWDLDPWLPKRRKKHNSSWQVAEIGGSDSHHTTTIGSIFTLFPGKTAEDLRRSIIKKETIAINNASMLKRYFYLGLHGAETIFKENPFKHHSVCLKGSKKNLKHMLKLILEK